MRQSSSDSNHDFAYDKQREVLLTALRNIIFPLVQMALPNFKGLEAMTMGPEADELLFALREYISHIVQDQSRSERQGETTRTVDIEDLDGYDSPTVVNETQEVLAEDALGWMQRTSLTPSPLFEVNVPLERDLSRVLFMARAELRTRIFNELPLRLLCFQKHGSKLEITLLDHAGIYAFLVQRLQDEIRDTNTSYLDVLSKPELLTQYAILSHTWLRSAPGEVTFGAWKCTSDLSHEGYRKLINFCRVAAEDYGLALGWMDTVCIDKSSSSELDESIRSMFKWYQKAAVCITYLADTTSLADMENDPWFTRGWTLQELLAPKCLKFYKHDWTGLVESPRSRTTITDHLIGAILTDLEIEAVQEKIEVATTMSKHELLYADSVPISRKMQWAAKRQVTRDEDAAYSLMGIFGINMSIAYGEGGQVAFTRLLKEILSTRKSGIVDIFNWAGDVASAVSSLLPSLPHAYLKRYSETPESETALPSRFPTYFNRYSEVSQSDLIMPITLTHLGLRIPVILLPAIPTSTTVKGWAEYIPMGHYYSETVTLKILFGSHWMVKARVGELKNRHYSLASYNVLDSKAFFESSGSSTRFAFAVLNCGGDKTEITIPIECLVVGISYKGDVMMSPTSSKQKTPTDRAIILQLRNRIMPRTFPKDDYYSIPRNELARHGMQFLNMYL